MSRIVRCISVASPAETPGDGLGQVAQPESVQVDQDAQLLLQYDTSRRTDDQMDFGAALEQDFEQADGVQHAAGAGDRKHKRVFHFRPMYSVAMPPVKGWRVTVRRPASRIRLANASPEGNSPTLLGR